MLLEVTVTRRLSEYSLVVLATAVFTKELLG